MHHQIGIDRKMDCSNRGSFVFSLWRRISFQRTRISKWTVSCGVTLVRFVGDFRESHYLEDSFHTGGHFADLMIPYINRIIYYFISSFKWITRIQFWYTKLLKNWWHRINCRIFRVSSTKNIYKSLFIHFIIKVICFREKTSIPPS